MDFAKTLFQAYVLGPNPIVIPPYQRPYEWDIDRWRDLWRDFGHLYRREGGPPHFMGVMIIETGQFVGGDLGLQLLVVDGQQRIVTMFLLEAALRDDAARRGSLPVSSYPLASMAQGESMPRLFPNAADKAAFDAAMNGEFVTEIPPRFRDLQVAEAYRFFRYQLWVGEKSVDPFYYPELPNWPGRRSQAVVENYSAWPEFDAVPVNAERGRNVLRQEMRFLQIQIERGDEEASVIFETINGKTTPLGQFDRLRNSIFVRMPDLRSGFHSKYWEPAEQSLRGVTYSSLRSQPDDQFFYEYVIGLGEGRVSQKTLHYSFIERVIKSVGYDVTPDTQRNFRDNIAIPVARAAQLYRLAVGYAKATEIESKARVLSDRAFRTIGEILQPTGGPTVPLHLKYLIAWDAGLIAMEDLELRLASIQSFIVRSMLAGRSFSPLRATFMGIAEQLRDDHTHSSLVKALADAGWPTDEEVLAGVLETPLTVRFGGAGVFPILRGLERRLSGDGAHPMSFGKGPGLYTVEHVYPQGNKLAVDWQQDLARWKHGSDEYDTLRHTLGNLTALTNKENSKFGQRGFSKKKELLKESVAPLRVHQAVLSPARWTPQAIKDRSVDLAKVALVEWPRDV